MRDDCRGITLEQIYGSKIVANSYRNILVTGGAGFIGSNYVRYLLDNYNDVNVTVYDKLTYAGSLDSLADVLDSIRFIKGDITDINLISNVMKGIDAVVNFAAESHVDRSLIDSRPFIRTNVEGVLILIDEARRQGVKRFLQVSTDEVYGDLYYSDKHSIESDVFAPKSPYAASKASAEHLVKSNFHSYDYDVVITRGSNTYGPYQYPEKIIPLFITNAIDNKPLPVYGNGMAVRDYMHVEDHVSGIDKVLRKGKSGEAYNLGAREKVTGIEVAEKILTMMNKPLDLITYVADRPGHDYRYSVDPQKAESIGWKRSWVFNEGLKHTIDWYIQNESWWRKIKERL